MNDKEKVQDFQRKIYQKAKQSPDFKFYVLYDKVKLFYFLCEAYRRVKVNKGAPGVDGKTFEDIEKEGLIEFLYNIKEELENRTYRPFAVLRRMIPKANGKMRPLGIPTIKDRVVQMSCKMVIEPIFEADFEETSYGFRPERSAKDAINRIKEHLRDGKTQVYDADLSAYFDTIPHDKLLKLIAMRISDKNIIHLIKMWLKAPIVENGKISGGKKNKKGTPQGGVISPLLANIYLHLLDKLINKTEQAFRKFGITIVRYADDWVIMAKSIPDKAIIYIKGFLEKMELQINEEKSRMVKATESSFDFLGFTFRYDRDLYGKNKKYLNVIPSKKSLKRCKENISKYLAKRGHFKNRMLTKGLNEIIRGWLNYFTIPGTSYTAVQKEKLRWYLIQKLRRYFIRKSQRGCKRYGYNAYFKLVSNYGLINLREYPKLIAVKA